MVTASAKVQRESAPPPSDFGSAEDHPWQVVVDVEKSELSPDQN